MATWFEQFGNWNTKATAGLMGGGFGKGLGSLGINSSNIGGIANTIGQIGTGLLAGQNQTGIGNAMQTIGGLASNIPGVGGLIGAGVGVLGGLVNAAFGSNINDEFVAQTENQANQIGNRIFGSNTNADLLNDWQSVVMQSDVSKSEVGSDGWFSSKASDKTRELNRQIEEANRRQLANFNVAAQNVDASNDLRILQNISAYGGPINSFRKYYSKGGYLNQAKALIRQNEGWREKPYADAPKGKNWRSVGYGFNDSGFREKYPEGISKHYEHGITKKQAEEELDYFLSKAEKQLKSIYGRQWNDFTDGQKAAILDTYYQRPASVGKSSRFYKAVTSGEDAGKYLGVAGFDKRNKIRQGVFGGSQDYVNLGAEIENPSANSSSLQEVTPFTPVVHDLDLSGIIPTQAKALELDLSSPVFDLSMFGSTPTQQESYIPTVGTVEDFLASYRDFEDNLFSEGGYKTTGGAGYTPKISNKTIEDFEKALVHGSDRAMKYVKAIGLKGIPRFVKEGLSELDYNNGVPENTYLLPRHLQEREFLKNGYVKGKEGDYGLVKKAVGNRNIPVYQRNPDSISRDKLVVLGNTYTTLFEPQYRLEDPGSAPTAVYTDGQGNFYQKQWDLNDYGGEGGSTAGIAGKMLDFIGSPTVVTTGFQPIKEDYHPYFYSTIAPMMEKKGLVPTDIDGKTAWTLPEITITGKKKKALGGNLFDVLSGTFKEINKVDDMSIFNFGGGLTHGSDWDTGISTHKVGDVVDVTPEEVRYLKSLGYEFKVIG